VFDDRSPIYRQIADQVKADVVNGTLDGDEQVMSTNQYAAYYRINPATVAKAFQQLVDERVLYKKRGIGMFVSPTPATPCGPSAGRPSSPTSSTRWWPRPGPSASPSPRSSPGSASWPGRETDDPRHRGHGPAASLRGRHRPDDLGFTLGGGRIHGLLGRNGSGKTSLLSVLAGFRKPSGGTVRIDGQPVLENLRITRQVCLIRETGDTGDRDDRVRYALWTAARLRPGWDAGHADALVERFEIPRHKKLRELSLGQQSALGMIFGLATRAPVTPARSSSRPT
jgi:hypothetical protein